MLIKWYKYPALHLGLCFTLALASVHNPYLLIAAIPLLTRWIAFLAIPLFALYAYLIAPPASYTGPLDFYVANVKPHKTHFQTGFLYTGHAQGLGPALYYSKECLPADKVFHFDKAALTEGFIKGKDPQLIERPWALAERRFCTKEKVKTYIAKHYGEYRTRVFLSGLVTGDVENLTLKFQFLQLGLAHLLAISGFHFALLALFLSFFLEKHFRQKTVAVLLLTLLTGYFLFIGPSPSVMRAWIAALLFLIARILDRQSTPLNALGVALALSLLLEPSVAFQLGFQLSFAATAGILIFTPRLYRLLDHLILPRPRTLVQRMPLFDRTGYIALTYLKKGLALLLAVHLVTLPLLLTAFGTFPFASLLYNLFYPPLVSLSLFLFFLSILFPLLHVVNALYTQAILALVEFPPKAFLYTLHLDLPYGVTFVLLATLFYLGLYDLDQKEKILHNDLHILWGDRSSVG